MVTTSSLSGSCYYSIQERITMFIKLYDEIPKEAKTIREAVFIKEQGFKEEFDEIDDVAKHVLLFDGDIPVGTCRFL